MIQDPRRCRWESVVRTSKYQVNRNHLRAAGHILTCLFFFFKEKKTDHSVGGRYRWFNSPSLSVASL